MVIRKRYDVSLDVGVDSGGPSLTKQSFKDECDINNILRKYIKTGVLNASVKAQQMGDFSNVGDYHQAMNTVIAAHDAFMNLPSKIRERFDNDAGNFLAFMSDAKNEAEAVELGLAVRKPVVAASDAPVPNPGVVPPPEAVPPVST